MRGSQSLGFPALSSGSQTIPHFWRKLPKSHYLITALIIINTAWPLPLQNPSFQVFFFSSSVKLHFSQRDLLSPNKLCCFWEQGKRRKNLALAYLQRSCISLPLCSQIPFSSSLCSAKRKGEGKTTQSRSGLVYTASKLELQKHSFPGNPALPYTLIQGPKVGLGPSLSLLLSSPLSFLSHFCHSTQFESIFPIFSDIF